MLVGYGTEQNTKRMDWFFFLFLSVFPPPFNPPPPQHFWSGQTRVGNHILTAMNNVDFCVPFLLQGAKQMIITS